MEEIFDFEVPEPVIIDNAETRPKPCYLILALDEYYELNCLLSTLEGFNIKDDTHRMFTLNPRAAKTEITESGYVPKLVMPVSSQLQIDYPLIFEKYEKYDSYIPTEEEIYRFAIMQMSLYALGWTATQFSAVHGIGKQLTIVVNQQLIDALPNEMIEQLPALGINIEVV